LILTQPLAIFGGGFIASKVAPGAQVGLLLIFDDMMQCWWHRLSHKWPLRYKTMGVENLAPTSAGEQKCLLLLIHWHFDAEDLRFLHGTSTDVGLTLNPNGITLAEPFSRNFYLSVDDEQVDAVSHVVR